MPEETTSPPATADRPQEPAKPPSGPINKPLIAGAVLIVLLALIGAAELTRPKANSAPKKGGARMTMETSPASPVEITNFERQTQQEAQELARLQAQKEALQRTLEAAQQASTPDVGNSGTVPGQTVDLNALAGMQRQQQLAAAGYYQPSAQQAGANLAQQEAIAERKQEEQALHASNIALDLRNDPRNSIDKQSSASASDQTNSSSGNNTAPPSPDAVEKPVASPPVAKSKTYDFDSATGNLYRLFEGTIIETVLTNRINGASAGPVNCMVTTDVYAHDNQTLLIPQGSRVLGKVNAVVNGNQQRLFVAFHRIIMPDGYSVSLDQFTGLNQVGETGLRDIVNHHYLQIFGSSLAIAAIGGVAQIGNGYGGFGYDPMVAIRSGVSQSMAESSTRVLDHFLNQLPTFIVRERARVKIYIAGDLLLPAYQNHTMPGDL